MPSESNLLIVGTGVVGSALLEIIRGPLADRIHVVGIANSRGAVLESEREPDIFTSALPALLAKPKGPKPHRIDDAVLDRLAAKRGTLVDATAEDEIPELYERALQRGIHVVTANKKPIAGSWATRERLFDPSRRRYGAQLRYGATVGAALPVIETLANLVRTGDRVSRIDCVLSGTLGFICNSLGEGVSLSQAIAVARERGFTEPDAREDLRGADVARKAVILARELGARLETADVALEPFLPREVLDAATPETLDQVVAKLDAGFEAAGESNRRRNEKLVYLARIEVDADGTVQASAAPRVVPTSHPAAQLQGASALVAFTTARHSLDPLVIRGSGAGGAVTASAILADVLEIASR